MEKQMTIFKEIQDKQFEDVLREYQEYKIIKKQVEDKLNEFECQIKERLSKEKTFDLACGPFTCKLSDVNRSGIDKEFLENQFHDIYEKCVKTSSYKKLTVK